MEPSYILAKAYQFHVAVQGISPLIWRHILIRGDMSLATLHTILQLFFAWSDTHLHSFHIHGKAYGCARLGRTHFDDNSRHVLLADLHLH